MRVFLVFQPASLGVSVQNALTINDFPGVAGNAPTTP